MESFIGALFGIGIYFTPTIVAYFRRDKANVSQVAVINTFLGWTLIGWVIALVLALKDPNKGQQQPVVNVHVNQQVGEGGHTPNATVNDKPAGVTSD